jgi:hypothetical protein
MRRSSGSELGRRVGDYGKFEAKASPFIGSCVTIFGSVPDVGGDGSQSETVLMTQR